MQVHSDIHKLPEFQNAVLTIGTFDGVHSGHRQIISQLKQQASAIGGETVIVTFHPHPRLVLHALEGRSQSIKLLTTLPEKIELMQRQGVDHLVVVPFSEEFSTQPARAYIMDFLVARFRPHTIIIGYDHRFGKDREGDFHLMESFAQEGKFRVQEIPQYVLNNIAISSTAIRKALGEGDILSANKFLGYPYFMEGTVVEGNHLGATIGFPTANLDISNPNKLIPTGGVYAIQVSIQEMSSESSGRIALSTALPLTGGMINIGTRPTIGGTHRTIEANLFEFDGNLYGRNLRVYFRDFLRREQKFEGLPQLKAQLHQDRTKADALLSDYSSSTDPLIIL